ncbi:MAG: 1,4-dihydroxy-2-naphthoate octaprenyltransferase [Candidatus Sericytochromatia bacterium]|nr:MAG: 1,4-dihydroxy-2-naphthoate octaprenyltransferase [Candidatus Sericytochromatia bacterium]
MDGNRIKISNFIICNRKHDLILNIKVWIKAFRLRTLPLSLSGILLSIFLAYSNGYYNLKTSILCIITTLFLQILSNLANDYGDFVNGIDNKERLGPSRTVQSGDISPKNMKKAIIVFTILSLISGFFLIYDKNLFIFAPLGILAIIAAITYTIGRKPYGYIGLGDLSVFIFFGLVSVIGTYFLLTENFNYDLLLISTSIGLFSTAVLNINNIRDIESDKKSGKNSIPVRIGLKKAKIYHYFLLLFGILFAFLYTYINFKSYFQFLFLISIPFIVKKCF